MIYLFGFLYLLAGWVIMQQTYILLRLGVQYGEEKKKPQLSQTLQTYSTLWAQAAIVMLWPIAAVVFLVEELRPEIKP